MAETQMPPLVGGICDTVRMQRSVHGFFLQHLLIPKFPSRMKKKQAGEARRLANSPLRFEHQTFDRNSELTADLRDVVPPAVVVQLLDPEHTVNPSYAG